MHGAVSVLLGVVWIVAVLPLHANAIGAHPARFHLASTNLTDLFSPKPWHELNTQSCMGKKWVSSLLPQIHRAVHIIQRNLELENPKSHAPKEIGTALLLTTRMMRVHDIASSMQLNTQDQTEMFSHAMCRANRNKDVGESISLHMQEQMTTWLPSFMTGMFDPIAKIFTSGFLGPLLRAIVNAVVDAFVDLFTLGLIAALAAILGEDVATLGDSIEADVLFFCPPALTIMLTGSITLRLTRSMTGTMVRSFARYMTNEATPSITRKIAHDLSSNVQNSLQTSLLHQLHEPLVHTLSYGLKDALPHYYYCTHCYYYGDYCQYCFYNRDYNWLNRAWWQGRLKPKHAPVPLDPNATDDGQGNDALEQNPTPKNNNKVDFSIPITKRTGELLKKLQAVEGAQQEQSP